MRHVVPMIVMLGCSSRNADDPPSVKPAMKPDTPRVEAFVTKELAKIRAATATDLIASAPPRALVAAKVFPLPHAEGRTLIVVVGLAPGKLPVPTELEYLRYTLQVADDGTLTATSHPDRADLVVAVEHVLADEEGAIAAADAALTRAKVTLPPGFRSWRDAARSATYDSRLPAADFGTVVGPSWNFIFEPWTNDRGWNQVMLDARLGVQMVNGRTPP